MKLLISQKDQLYDLIENDYYFTPSQFEIVETRHAIDEVLTDVRLKSAQYFFRFHPAGSSSYRDFYVSFSPGEHKVFDNTTPLYWSEGMSHFQTWLKALKRELTALNKWRRLAEEIEYVKTAYSEAKLSFSYNDYIELFNKIEQVKMAVKSIPLLEDQQKSIINHLTHLTELAKEMNKFDWKNLFIGTIISIIIQLNVTKENADLLLKAIKHVFAGYLLP